MSVCSRLPSGPLARFLNLLSTIAPGNSAVVPRLTIVRKNELQFIQGGASMAARAVSAASVATPTIAHAMGASGPGTGIPKGFKTTVINAGVLGINW